MTEDEDDTAWLCWCGHFQEDAFHCDRCGAQPPWGCACCEDADDGEGEENDDYFDPEKGIP